MRRSTLSEGLLLATPPGAGASELLKQTFDRLFFEKAGSVPFYFELRRRDLTASNAARRFVHEFIVQAVAFRRRDPGIILISPGLSELSELAAPEDGHWIDRLVDYIRSDAPTDDERSFVRNCLTAPARAAANGVKPFVMIDDIHESPSLEPGFFDEFRDIFLKAKLPFVFAGKRRFSFGGMETSRLAFKPLSFDDAGRLVERLAAEYEVRISNSARDLIVVQLKGNPRLISAFLHSAYVRERLESFQSVEQVYCDSLFGGSIGQRFDSILKSCDLSPESERDVISLLFVTAATPELRLSTEAWREQLGEDGFEKTLELLNLNEVLRLNSSHVEVSDENTTLNDYVASRFRLEVSGENRALVYGGSLAAFIRRAPEIMSSHYRRMSALGLRGVMARFAGQKIPRAAINYDDYRADLKGLTDAETWAALENADTYIPLPKVFFVSDTVSLYRPIETFIERERSAAARGFDADGGEVIWLAAEVDSKFEADAETAEFWCDRLETAAIKCDLKNYVIWLIAPEGFSDDALRILTERGAIGSCRRQFEMLRHLLGMTPGKKKTADLHEYEFTMPMDDEAELIAAHAVEEIAKRAGFDPRSINQIKTALVEAVINASEHSLSPDRKISQKIVVSNDRITITIANRGLRIKDPKPDLTNNSDGRRGWGLILMQRLMDDVLVENTDDGTRIILIKLLQAETAEKVSAVSASAASDLS